MSTPAIITFKGNGISPVSMDVNFYKHYDGDYDTMIGVLTTVVERVHQRCRDTALSYEASRYGAYFLQEVRFNDIYIYPSGDFKWDHLADFRYILEFREYEFYLEIQDKSGEAIFKGQLSKAEDWSQEMSVHPYGPED